MVERVVRAQHVHQCLPVGRSGGEALQRHVAHQSGLPQHQIAGGIDAPFVEKQLAGLEMLATEATRVDAQIGVETVFGGDTRLHVRLEAFRAGHLDGLVRRPGEDAGGHRTRRRHSCRHAPRSSSVRPAAGRWPSSTCSRPMVAFPACAYRIWAHMSMCVLAWTLIGATDVSVFRGRGHLIKRTGDR